MHGKQRDVSCVVLAGGRGSRLDNADKGLLPFAERPLIAHILDALRPQVAHILISANRNLDAYRRFGHPVVPDLLAGYQGPLAGVAAALRHTRTPYLLTVPCDSPLLAPELAARMMRALRDNRAELAVAADGARAHPVFCLFETRLADSLDAFLAGPDRKIDKWFEQLRVCRADFADRPDMFVNINTPREYAALRA